MALLNASDFTGYSDSFAAPAGFMYYYIYMYYYSY